MNLDIHGNGYKSELFELFYLTRSKLEVIAWVPCIFMRINMVTRRFLYTIKIDLLIITLIITVSAVGEKL